MKTDDFIHALSDELDCTLKDSRRIMEGFWHCVACALRDGHNVTFAKFGSFRLRRWGKRNKYSFVKGETQTLEPVTRLEFFCAPHLREMIENTQPLKESEKDEEVE